MERINKKYRKSTYLMKFVSNKLKFLMLCFCLVLFSSILSVCSLFDDSVVKTNFTKADLEKLRWLEGSWGVDDANGRSLSTVKSFRFLDNGTIETDQFSDEGSYPKSIYIESGRIMYQTLAVVTLEDSLIEFADNQTGTVRLWWRKESDDVWTERFIVYIDDQGRSIPNAREIIQRMRRLKK